ncbi:FecR domain-containing protein [Desulfurobacterium sp.]
MKKGLLTLIILLTIPVAAHGYVGKVAKAVGKVEIVKKGTFKGIFWKKVRGLFDTGDVVRTKRKSRAEIHFIDRTTVTMLANSRLIVEKYIPSGSSIIENPYGKVIYRVVKRTKGEFIIKTPVALIGVKGTEFFVDSSITQVTVTVKTGTVEVRNLFFPGDVIKLKKDETVTIKPIKKHFRPKPASEELIKKLFSGKPLTEHAARHGEEPDNQLFEEKKDETIDEMRPEQEEKTKANFNIVIPDTSIEGL